MQAPINTFDHTAPPALYAGPITSPVQLTQPSVTPRKPALPAAAAGPRGPFIIDRYSDLRAPTPAPVGSRH